MHSAFPLNCLCFRRAASLCLSLWISDAVFHRLPVTADERSYMPRPTCLLKAA
ncbi:MAG: hypothetical protein H7A43_07800 [Verrucomicrobia bacterium]|nr:hypothetical protein [Verrucomicrobiota bacterium]